MNEEVHPDAVSILYDSDISNMQYFHDLPDETRMMMNNLWEELKIESKIGVGIFVICGIIVATFGTLLVVHFIRKQIRSTYYD